MDVKTQKALAFRGFDFEGVCFGWQTFTTNKSKIQSRTSSMTELERKVKDTT